MKLASLHDNSMKDSLTLIRLKTDNKNYIFTQKLLRSVLNRLRSSQCFFRLLSWSSGTLKMHVQVVALK